MDDQCHCGLPLVRGLVWDDQMACVVRIARCPDGCTNRMDWVWPEDATPEEREELGVIMVP